MKLVRYADAPLSRIGEKYLEEIAKYKGKVIVQ